MVSILVIALAILLILGTELFMWRRFEVRHQGIDFPTNLDRSYFGFFTHWRIRAIVLLHTLTLTITVSVFIWALW